MAITGHRLLQKGIRTKAEGTTQGLERYTYSVTYQVQTDDPETPPKDLYAYFRANSTLPYFGRKFRFNGTSDAGAICSELNIDYIERSEGIFLAEATYTPIEGGDSPDQRPSEDDGEETEDPLKWRKEISVTSSPTSFPVMEAIFRGFDPPNIANPFLQPGLRTPPVNSAMVPFDPPPEFDRSFRIVRISWRQKSFGVFDWDDWIDVVNNRPFKLDWRARYNFQLEIDPFKGRIKSFGGTYQFDNNISHWRVELEIWIHPVSWREQLADMGTVRRAGFGDPDGAGGTISTDSNVRHPGIPNHKEIVDIDGNPLMQPVLLDGNGQPMKLMQPDGGNKKPVPVWLHYQYYKEKDFAGLGLFEGNHQL